MPPLECEEFRRPKGPRRKAARFGEDVTHRFLDQAGLSLCLPRSQIFEMGGASACDSGSSKGWTAEPTRM